MTYGEETNSLVETAACYKVTAVCKSDNISSVLELYMYIYFYIWKLFVNDIPVLQFLVVLYDYIVITIMMEFELVSTKQQVQTLSSCHASSRCTQCCQYIGLLENSRYNPIGQTWLQLNMLPLVGCITYCHLRVITSGLASPLQEKCHIADLLILHNGIHSFIFFLFPFLVIYLHIW